MPTRSWYKHCLIRAAGRVHVPPKGPKGFLSTDTEIKEHDKDALSCVRFFRPAQVGVEVAPAEGGVRVTRADKGMPIGKAGLQVGDVVRAIDGAATDSPDAFRKLLRKKVAQGGYGLFEVRRGDKAVEVRPHFGG